MSLRVTFIQGGGVGFDQAPAVKRILEAAGVAIEWDEHVAGLPSIEQGGPVLPPAMLDSVQRNGLALKSKLMHPPGHQAGNFNVQFRKALDLFAAVRPIRNLAGLKARHSGVDLLIVRELTEDLWGAIEHEIVPGVVQSLKVVTEAACRRFFRFALDWARAHGRKRVFCVHKANILKLADGLFLDLFRELAREYPDLEPREVIVDNCCMQMVLRPQQFDVLVMGNLYGDLVSDLGAGVIGGISGTAGINVGDGIRVYESFHGASREVVPADRANPLPLLMPALELLRSVGHAAVADRILRAVESVLTEGQVRTTDLGGDDTTTRMTEAVLLALD